MADILDDFLFPRRPTAERPLLGQTVLVVEDSRYAGETLRLMCLRGGARIRRADSLRAAARHLGSYRPTIVLTDLGLPDGSGLDLIGQLAAATPRVPVLIALSGDPAQRDAALAAGADAFLDKPFGSIAQFHAAILAHLPKDAQPAGLRRVSDECVAAGDDSLADDYAMIASMLGSTDDGHSLDYAASFAANLARSTGDAELLGAAVTLQRNGPDAAPGVIARATLVGVLGQRLAGQVLVAGRG